MNIQFLKIISESYILDNPGVKVTQDQVLNELTTISKLLQTEDPALYNEIYELEKVRQQQLLKCYIDTLCENEGLIKAKPMLSDDLDEVLEESIVVDFVINGQMIIYALCALSTILAKKPLTKAVFKSFSVLGKSISSLAGKIAKGGRMMSLRYAIIQENSKRCYVKCDLTDIKKLHLMTYMAIKESSSMITASTRQQAWCLRDCFLESLIDVISLHMENYFSCLKKTGGSVAISQTDTDDIIKLISSTNIATSCQGFYDEAKKGLTDFYTAIDLIFEKNVDDDKKLIWINRLRSKVYESRQSVMRPSGSSQQPFIRPSGPSKPQGQQNIQKYSK